MCSQLESLEQVFIYLECYKGYLLEYIIFIPSPIKYVERGYNVNHRAPHPALNCVYQVSNKRRFKLFIITYLL